ncbi:MotA/TolQ/ExbB proton channel family protein [methane-oxidizing endosymbiont of Gigantopelta aegis]|uniref:MotA/TolQ/ExbB proton channel family protein n=1 Tax=methane-oxidizing endosymbiont of Gigantopelta aegis TaxID=2794938 RepID=UPI0018DCD1B6|nr:MotA/TolQ/ExbB proton channel family protein [methane-oxidizing endosymbiont of Gigantopelta aegis]
MQFLFEQIELIREFLQAGGIILSVILWVSFLLWFLIIERLLFFKLDYPKRYQQYLESWQQRHDKKSPYARYFRRYLISQAVVDMRKTMPIIKMLTAISPLLGLLGTVTGMIHVFDTMAITGNGNPRAMAAGISQATITTMAGMVIAIGGLYFNRLLEQRIDDETHHLTDSLQTH